MIVLDSLIVVVAENVVFSRVVVVGAYAASGGNDEVMTLEYEDRSQDGGIQGGEDMYKHSAGWRYNVMMLYLSIS